MKNLILLASLVIGLSSCKKEVPESIRLAQEAKACFIARGFPNLPKKDAYLEGEIDGQPFVISTNDRYYVGTSLSDFFQDGYQPEYGLASNLRGNSFSASSANVTGPKLKTYYIISVDFPLFRGDTMAYKQYFNQFKQGKTFKFREKNLDVKGLLEPETVGIYVSVFDCAATTANSSVLSSSEAVQSGSYFRVIGEKEYKDASGQVYKRDITIEFDVKVGFGEALHIKNGRLLFSY